MWTILRLVKKGDYTYAVVPDHPNATKNGYVLEHRVVVENKLGRLLTKQEIVHHINENKKDNSPENLEVKSNSEHVREHGRSKGRKVAYLRCPSCGKEFKKFHNATHLARKGSYTCCSKRCRGLFSRDVQLRGLTKEHRSLIDENVIKISRELTVS